MAELDRTQPAQPEPSPTDRNWAVLTHLGTAVAVLLGGWFLNILVPLAVLLVRGSESEFVAGHAREELNFQISLTIYVLVAGFVTLLTLGLALLILIPFAIVVGIVILVVIVQASLAASRGEAYRYPLTIRFVR